MKARQQKGASEVAVPGERIAQAIFIVRGCKALLDSELAAMYGVATKVLLQAVKRNLARFPDDFMLQLMMNGIL